MDGQGWLQPARKGGRLRLFVAAGLLVALVAGVGALVRVGDQPADGLGVTVEEHADTESGGGDAGTDGPDGRGRDGDPGDGDADGGAADGGGQEAELGGGSDEESAEDSPEVVEAAGEWQAIPDPPGPRRFTGPVWTGAASIHWGGMVPPEGGLLSGRVEFLADGVAYDPQADGWRTLPPAPIAGRRGQLSVWTGEELVVWGGTDETRQLDDGAAYDPDTDEWRRLSEAPLSPRHGALGLWTGDEVVVLGGWDNAGGLRDGAAYDPATDRWRSLTPPPEGTIAASPTPPGPNAAATWTGTRVVIAAPTPSQDDEHRLLAYDPEADSWSRLPRPPESRDDSSPTLVATDEQTAMVTHTGRGEPRVHVLDPEAKDWRTLKLPDDFAGAPNRRADTVATAWGDGDVYLLYPHRHGKGFVVTLDTGHWRRLPGHGQSPDETVGFLRTEASWTGDALLFWSAPSRLESESVQMRWEPAPTQR